MTGEKRTAVWQQYTVKDIVFLAVLAAALTITGMITMPLVMTVTLFGVRNAAAAVFYGTFGVLGLMKVRKPGALFLLGLFNGVVLLMISPVMFFNNVTAAFLAEAIALLLFKNYADDKSIIAAAGLFIPLTLPFSIIFAMLLNGRTFAQLVEQPLVSVIICAAAVLLSFLGAFAGHKIGTELQKAGKLK